MAQIAITHSTNDTNVQVIRIYSSKNILCHVELSEIGRGSFGTVLHAKHEILGDVAVKCMTVTGGERQQSTIENKFLKEYNKLQECQHPNVVIVFGVTKWSGAMGILMEFCAGGSLRDLLLNDSIDVGLVLILRMNLDIAAGVAYLHNCGLNVRVIHGDLKPENILLTARLICKITDFGSARIASYTGSTTIEVGREKIPFTLYYAAPEKLLKGARPKKEQDAYSCGVIQHMTLSRGEPYQSQLEFQSKLELGLRPNCDAIEELKNKSSGNNRKIVEVVEGAMVRCWDQDPSQRPSMITIRDEFQTLMANQDPAVIAQQVADAVCGMNMQHPPQNPTVPLEQFSAEFKKFFSVGTVLHLQPNFDEQSPAQLQERLAQHSSDVTAPKTVDSGAQMEPLDINAGTSAQVQEPPSQQVVVAPCFLVIGGWNSERDCVKYDITTGETEHIQSLNLARCGATSIVVGNKIVVLGGAPEWGEKAAHRSCEVYDTHENILQWNSLPDMLIPRKWCGSGYLAGHIFVTGGRSGREIFSNCEKLADGGDAWMAIPNLLHARYAHGTVVCKGSLYCIGGRDRSERLSSCERFDLGRKNWNYIPILNKARSEFACVEMGGCIYAIGGFNDDDGCLDSVERYNPERNNWEYVASLRSPRSHSCACVVQDKIYVIGGSCNGRHLRSVEVYDPALDSWTLGFETVKPAWMATAVAL